MAIELVLTAGSAEYRVDNGHRGVSGLSRYQHIHAVVLSADPPRVLALNRLNVSAPRLVFVRVLSLDVYILLLFYLPKLNLYSSNFGFLQTEMSRFVRLRF